MKAAVGVQTSQWGLSVICRILVSCNAKPKPLLNARGGVLLCVRQVARNFEVKVEVKEVQTGGISIG